MIRRGRGEDGVAETVVIFPVAMVVILVLVQVALWAHAAQVVQAAAAQGDQAARAYGSTPAAGASAARGFLDRLGAGVVSGAQVSSTAAAGVAVVSVTARAESILPGFSLPVSARSVGVVQTYLPSG